MASVQQNDVRTEKLDHWPMFDDMKGWCKRLGCKGTPKVYCAKFISVSLQIKLFLFFSSLNSVHIYRGLLPCLCKDTGLK